MLARAGLLARCCCCTTHWQSLAALAEAFPELDASGNLFEVGPDRFTDAGGAATLDLAVHRIALAHGRELADRVAEACVLDRPRAADAPQRRAREARLSALRPKLTLLARLMEANVEEPLTQGQLASRVGLSRRQVERLFQRHLGRTPSQHYLGVRLERARVLLAETDLPVVGVACATGFVSASHFATCYRQHFGRTPRMERLRVA
jgi:AraC family transcriptional regulator, glycine betaine-responsive activator